MKQYSKQTKQTTTAARKQVQTKRTVLYSTNLDNAARMGMPSMHTNRFVGPTVDNTQRSYRVTVEPVTHLQK